MAESYDFDDCHGDYRAELEARLYSMVHHAPTSPFTTSQSQNIQTVEPIPQFFSTFTTSIGSNVVPPAPPPPTWTVDTVNHNQEFNAVPQYNNNFGYQTLNNSHQGRNNLNNSRQDRNNLNNSRQGGNNLNNSRQGGNNSQQSGRTFLNKRYWDGQVTVTNQRYDMRNRHPYTNTSGSHDNERKRIAHVPKHQIPQNVSRFNSNSRNSPGRKNNGNNIPKNFTVNLSNSADGQKATMNSVFSTNSKNRRQTAVTSKRDTCNETGNKEPFTWANSVSPGEGIVNHNKPTTTKKKDNISKKLKNPFSNQFRVTNAVDVNSTSICEVTAMDSKANTSKYEVTAKDSKANKVICVESSESEDDDVIAIEPVPPPLVCIDDSSDEDEPTAQTEPSKSAPSTVKENSKIMLNHNVNAVVIPGVTSIPRAEPETPMEMIPPSPDIGPVSKKQSGYSVRNKDAVKCMSPMSCMSDDFIHNDCETLHISEHRDSLNFSFNLHHPEVDMFSDDTLTINTLPVTKTNFQSLDSVPNETSEVSYKTLAMPPAHTQKNSSCGNKEEYSIVNRFPGSVLGVYESESSDLPESVYEATILKQSADIDNSFVKGAGTFVSSDGFSQDCESQTVVKNASVRSSSKPQVPGAEKSSGNALKVLENTGNSDSFIEPTTSSSSKKNTSGSVQEQNPLIESIDNAAPNSMLRRLSNMTGSMTEFYDHTWGGESFNHDRIRSKMAFDKSQWAISQQDRTGGLIRERNWKNVRCHNCNRMGHAIRDCPEPVRPNVCYMCGELGHQEPRCPNKLCLKCGSTTQIFCIGCSNCRQFNFRTCSLCNIRGHMQETCPDLWRRYHLTTDPSKFPTQPFHSVLKHVRQMYCCNCGRRGHEQNKCRDLQFREYAPILSEIISYGPTYPREENIPKDNTDNINKNNAKKRLSCTETSVCSSVSTDLNQSKTMEKLCTPKMTTDTSTRITNVAENNTVERKSTLPDVSYDDRERDCSNVFLNDGQHLASSLNCNKNMSQFSVPSSTPSLVSNDDNFYLRFSQLNNKSVLPNTETVINKSCTTPASLPEYISINSPPRNTISSNEQRVDVLQDNSITNTDDAIITSKILMDKVNYARLSKDAGLKFLSHTTILHYVKWRWEIENPERYLYITGTKHSLSNFRNALMQFIKKDNISRMDYLQTKTFEIPQNSMKIVNFLQEKIDSLYRKGGNPFIIYTGIKRAFNNSFKGWNQKYMKNILHERRKLNMILFGQLGYREGSNNLAWLNDAIARLKTTCPVQISKKERIEINDRYKYIFSGMNHENYVEILDDIKKKQNDNLSQVRNVVKTPKKKVRIRNKQK